MNDPAVTTWHAAIAAKHVADLKARLDTVEAELVVEKAAHKVVAAALQAALSGTVDVGSKRGVW